MDVDIQMVKDYKKFAECNIVSQQNFKGEESPDELMRWHETLAGKCAARADYSFRETFHKRRRLGQERLDTFDERRLHLHTHTEFSPVRVECTNSYLSWAKVWLKNSTHNVSEIRCAYQFGATIPSITSAYGEVETLHKQMKKHVDGQDLVRCWQLYADACVVAFTDLRDFMRVEREEDEDMAHMSLLFGSIFGIVGIFALCWFCKGKCSGTHEYQRVATNDDVLDLFGGISLSERVNFITEHAPALIKENTPPISGLTTPRTIQGTIEVVHSDGEIEFVPQNLGAEFVQERCSGAW